MRDPVVFNVKLFLGAKLKGKKNGERKIVPSSCLL
jgi:hypothetical protein